MQDRRTTWRMLEQAISGVLLASLLLVAGCAYHWPAPPSGSLSQRILAPPATDPLAAKSPSESSPVSADDSSTGETPLPELKSQPGTSTSKSPVQPHAIVADVEDPAVCAATGEPLELQTAIETGLARNPHLALMRERAAAARAGKQVAFAGFLPESRVFYRNVQGAPETSKFVLPTIPTLVGNVAYGGTSDNFQLAELHVQWTVWDFGRTLGTYGRAVAISEGAELLYRRAMQTVTFNVTAAYFAALDARARRIIAEESVRRAESHLRDARGYLERGTYDKNDLYRAELQVAEMKLLLINTRTEEGVAIAALNRVMGINVSTQTRLVDELAEPSISLSLASSLEIAVASREELAAAEQGILDAQLGEGIRKADYLPKIFVAGNASRIDGEGIQESELLSGGLNIELDLFTGGRKIGAQRVAAAEVRAAIAQAREICDTIAYEVNDAQLSLVNARERIAVSKVAVEQATENLRVYNSRFRRGDAKPTDVVDAELAMTRSQQNYMAALYDYQTAVARLSYAVGADVTALPLEQNDDASDAELISVAAMKTDLTTRAALPRIVAVVNGTPPVVDTPARMPPLVPARSLPPAVILERRKGTASNTALDPVEELPFMRSIRPSLDIPEGEGNR